MDSGTGPSQETARTLKNKSHSIIMQGMNGGVLKIEFLCDDKVIVSGVSDRNINMNCPICRKDFVTIGEGFDKIILH